MEKLKEIVEFHAAATTASKLIDDERPYRSYDDEDSKVLDFKRVKDSDVLDEYGLKAKWLGEDDD